MKLIEIKLENFRGYENETSVKINDLTMLVGRNDAGKSTIFEALDIFFNESVIENTDCCKRTTSNEVKISCVFDDLPDSIVIDEQFSTTLKDEYLLRGDQMLEICKVFDCTSAKGKLDDIQIKALHPISPQVSDLLSLKLTELKALVKELNIPLNGTAQNAKSPLRKLIWNSYAALPLEERYISVKKETGKDIYDQLQKSIPMFALFKSDRASTDQDAEAQDPLKTAIKEAISRRTQELGNVIQDIQSELLAVAEKTVEKIKEMSPELASELKPTIKNKAWDSLFSVSLTGEDDIPVNKRGSGTRRLILLNFFRAKAEEGALSESRGIIYAVEEPETSQHPNHQLLLLDAFEQLVEQGGCQVLLTTHTPTLARRVDQKNLRLITKLNGQPSVEDGSQGGNTTLENIVHTLGVLPDHDVKVFLGVEGKHDISFLKAISEILSNTEPDIPNLAAKELSGELVFVPLGGSSLELWVNRLKGLNRPEFYITDRDNPPPMQAKYESFLTQWLSRGCAAWATSKRELENYIHLDLIKNEVPTYIGQGHDFDDVPNLWAEAQHNAAPGAPVWASLDEKKRSQKSSNAKKQLNNKVVKNMTPDLLNQSDPNDEIRTWLRAIGLALNT